MNTLDIFPNLYIPPDERSFFHDNIRILNLSEAEYFVSQNNRCDKIGFIHSGLMHSTFRHDNNEEVVAIHKKYQFVSSFTSLLSGEPSKISIQAAVPTRLSVISDETFHKLLERHSCWVHFWLNVFRSHLDRYSCIEQKFYQENHPDRNG